MTVAGPVDTGSVAVRVNERASQAGLTTEQAAARLALRGFNELADVRGKSLAASALEIAREPMTLLLLGCGAIYVVLGDHGEALMLLGFVVLIMGITLFQERKTEHSLEALRDMASPRALVIRDGSRVRIAGREVVDDDLVVLTEGDRVPADVTILESGHLAVDESILTGESAPVLKVEWDKKLPVARPGGENLPFAYAGTLVVQGSAIARVHATGPRTEMGRIGLALKPKDGLETALQHETRTLVRRLAFTGATLSLLATVVYVVARGSVLGGLLAGLTLAMAILPNEFPVVVAIFLALGARRLSKRRVLTRRAQSIEAMGAATVLCVDKTGTLTQNRMAVRELSVEGAIFDVARLSREELPEPFHRLVEYSILAGRRDPFDPMERAFKAFGEEYLAGTEHLHSDYELVHEYPLLRELLAVTQVWRPSAGGDLVIAMKGAPESVADLCHMNDEALGLLKDRVDTLATGGLRVLAVASGAAPSAASATQLPARAHDYDFAFLGLVGLADPVREDVPDAVAECRAAGIRVVMITGDYPATALSVARSIGLDGAGSMLSGKDLLSMTAADLQKRVPGVAVFSRVLPEQKLQIVEALRANGEVVAMTGDGVNDAPALKAANIGVAMGGRGTDVAREASAIVLLDDDFKSLVEAVRSGRRIMDNLRKALTYILAVHVPIVGLTLFPLFFGWPLVLLPIHIACLHLIIDPACSVVFEAEAEEPDTMRRPPRAAAVGVFGQRALMISLLQGGFATALLVTIYGLALGHGENERVSRALVFATFMVANVGLVFTNRSWSPPGTGGKRHINRPLLWLAAGVGFFLALAIYAPGLRELFGFGALRLRQLGIALGGGLASIAWFEVYKRVSTRPRSVSGRRALHG
jgi:Ca2+-transporting ATPase